MENNSIIFKPIGIIRTPFVDEKGTPIQPAAAAGMKDEPQHHGHIHIPLSEVKKAEGRVEVDSAYVDGLKDLEGFDRIILLFYFHKTCREELLVKPYLDGANPHGVFATRAPCRPNKIGISCVKLVKIEKNVLFIEDVDILDGTPLLDIKPYVPQFDSFGQVRSGWIGDSQVAGRMADSRFNR